MKQNSKPKESKNTHTSIKTTDSALLLLLLHNIQLLQLFFIVKKQGKQIIIKNSYSEK